MAVENQEAVVANATFTASLATRVLNVSVADGKQTLAEFPLLLSSVPLAAAFNVLHYTAHKKWEPEMT